jgi:hypothetical protein
MELQIIVVNVTAIVMVLILLEMPVSILKDITLDLGIDNKEYLPKYCNVTSTHICNVKKKGFTDRIHCYDVDFPFYLKLQRFKCNGHYFNILHEHVILKLPTDIQSNLNLLVLDKMILVCTFD